MRAREIVDSWNTGKNLLLENSILVPEVDLAFNDWVQKTNGNSNWMLIGGIVVGFYTRPRTTTDVDVLFASENSIPVEVDGFKRNRQHAFTHKLTHVEIEVLTPESINIPKQLFNQVLQTSVEHNGVRIPSASGLVALKLMRSELQDLADIKAIMTSNDVDISGFSIPSEKIVAAEKIIGSRFVIYTK